MRFGASMRDGLCVPVQLSRCRRQSHVEAMQQELKDEVARLSSTGMADVLAASGEGRADGAASHGAEAPLEAKLQRAVRRQSGAVALAGGGGL